MTLPVEDFDLTFTLLVWIMVRFWTVFSHSHSAFCFRSLGQCLVVDNKQIQVIPQIAFFVRDRPFVLGASNRPSRRKSP